jgi:hypothetical protein
MAVFLTKRQKKLEGTRKGSFLRKQEKASSNVWTGQGEVVWLLGYTNAQVESLVTRPKSCPVHKDFFLATGYKPCGHPLIPLFREKWKLRAYP